jgi:guanylate kinase
MASCCLLKWSRPERKPPRIVVLAGPSAVGRSALVDRLVQQYPDKFGKTVSTTSRRPMEHEMDGR